MSTNISIVTYKNNSIQITKVINNCFKSEGILNDFYLIDNSPTNEIGRYFSQYKIKYVFNDANIGFGEAHNIAMRKTIEDGTKYHLVLNPDVYFEPQAIEKMYEFMEKNPDVGILMPKILYPDGSVQYLCKILPTPFDMLFRRFLPIKKIVEKRNNIYELRFTGYNKIMDVPYLSGCFMLIRIDALKKVGLFDERFFMYFEDVDLSRRVHEYYRTVYYPDVCVYHEFEKGSYKNFRLLRYHIKSAIQYFNKWGWFFDKKRREINGKILKELRENGFVLKQNKNRRGKE